MSSFLFMFYRNLADKIGSTDDEINAWMLIFNCVKTKLYACRRRRNAHTSFNSLPLDIVLSIFRDAMEAFTETSNYYEELFTIRSVCSAWKTCIDDHPLFWVVVFPQNSPPLHDFTIRKARTLALELHYPLYIGMMYQQENCQQLLACLDGLHWPLKAFHFYDPRGEEGYPLLESFLTSPAPNLQSFELTTSTSRRVLGTLFDGQAPALRTVFLKHVVLNSTFQPFSRLQRLKLVEVYGLTPSRLIQLLSHCPDLQQLNPSRPSSTCEASPSSHISLLRGRIGRIKRSLIAVQHLHPRWDRLRDLPRKPGYLVGLPSARQTQKQRSFPSCRGTCRRRSRRHGRASLTPPILPTSHGTHRSNP